MPARPRSTPTSSTPSRTWLALMALDDVVVATDYPGLGTAGVHPYLVGESEGRAVLDSVRAAKGIPEAGPARGLSCGDTRRAARPPSSPVSSPEPTHRSSRSRAWPQSPRPRTWGSCSRTTCPSGPAAFSAPTRSGAGRRSTARRSTRSSRPRIVPRSTGPRATASRPTARHTAPPSTRLPLPGGMLLPGALSREPWKRLLEENRPGRERIGAPVYVAQGSEDTIVRPSVTSDFVGALCRSGEIVRYEVLPGVDHLRAERASATSAVQWMRDRLDGKPARNGCAVPELSEPPSGVPPRAGDVSSSARPEPSSSPAAASRRVSDRFPR